MIRTFLQDEIRLVVSNNSLVEKRSVWRRGVLDNNGTHSLSRFLSGQIPYYYREPSNIAQDFLEQHDALYLIADMCRKAPTDLHHRCTHFAEILACVYIQKVLGLKILMRKLTQLTAENTNVHKMDVMCVDTQCSPYRYYWIEVKSSRQNDSKVYHRHGIYKQMIDSLEHYSVSDKRFDFVQIRDNLTTTDFSTAEYNTIRAELIPPGPTVIYQGLAVINLCTINKQDDDYIITEPCATSFDARILALTDIKTIAVNAYEALEGVLRVAEDGV